MKKIGVLLVLSLVILSLTALAIAEDNTTINDTASDDTTTTSETTTSQQDSSKIDLGFGCLEDKVGSSCEDANTVQELSLTILATPDNVFDKCVEKLKDKESGNHFGDIRDTSLAVLALDHAGEDTSDYEDWLLEQNITPKDLIWYLEQDSNQATQCKLSYDSKDYTININENKKIDANAGSCLTRAVSNFWLKISDSCFDETFKISCDKDFIATLLYKNQNSQTIFVLEGTESEPAFGTISLEVKSQCFPKSSGGNSCDYESTAWAALALMNTGHEIDEFIPYIVAMSDSNNRYLPNAFIYLLTDYEDYASKLIQEQELGNYWTADSSVYNKYYDTALALLSLSNSNSEQVVKARDWALFSQATNGCWANSIRDTAIMLWALEGRSGKGGGSSVTYCTEADFFCIPEAECPSNEKLSNYFCSGLSKTCCKTENLQLCSEYTGMVCDENKLCTGNERKASNTDSCCLGECVEKPQTTECEDFGYICRDACTGNQESVPYDCGSLSGSCCRAKTSSSSKWWLWLILILVVIGLVILGWIFRDKLKLFWFKIKTKFKRDKGSKKGGVSQSTGPRGPPGFPPRPGFPPIRRQPIQMQRPQARSQQRDTDRRDSAMQNVFQKLKDMSK